MAAFSVAMLVGAMAQSPLMLPYHIFGHGYKLLTLECCSVLAFDWALMTIALYSIYAVLTVFIDAVIRITLICKALR